MNGYCYVPLSCSVTYFFGFHKNRKGERKQIIVVVVAVVVVVVAVVAVVSLRNGLGLEGLSADFRREKSSWMNWRKDAESLQS
jgi:hypothetical protein